MLTFGWRWVLFDWRPPRPPREPPRPLEPPRLALVLRGLRSLSGLANVPSIAIVTFDDFCDLAFGSLLDCFGAMKYSSSCCLFSLNNWAPVNASAPSLALRTCWSPFNSSFFDARSARYSSRVLVVSWGSWRSSGVPGTVSWPSFEASLLAASSLASSFLPSSPPQAEFCLSLSL